MHFPDLYIQHPIKSQRFLDTAPVFPLCLLHVAVVCSIHPQTPLKPQCSSFSEVFRQGHAGQILNSFCLTACYAVATISFIVYILSGLHVMHCILDSSVWDVHSACDVIWVDTSYLCPFLTLQSWSGQLLNNLWPISTSIFFNIWYRIYSIVRCVSAVVRLFYPAWYCDILVSDNRCQSFHLLNGWVTRRWLCTVKGCRHLPL